MRSTVTCIVLCLLLLGPVQYAYGQQAPPPPAPAVQQDSRPEVLFAASSAALWGSMAFDIAEQRRAESTGLYEEGNPIFRGGDGKISIWRKVAYVGAVQCYASYELARGHPWRAVAANFAVAAAQILAGLHNRNVASRAASGPR